MQHSTKLAAIEAHGDTKKCPTDLRQGKGEDSKNFESETCA